jgi:Ankyrin repeat
MCSTTLVDITVKSYCALWHDTDITSPCVTALRLNPIQDGRTPLMIAAFDGHDSVASLLLSRGAAVDHVDTVSQSPFSRARNYFDRP